MPWTAPRFHHQWQPDTLYLEKGISPDTVRSCARWATRFCPVVVVARVEAIVIDGGWLQGGSDGRGTEKAQGY